MHRAVILLVGLLLCVSAAAVVLPSIASPARPAALPSAPAPVSAPGRAGPGWNAQGGPSGFTTLRIQSVIAANRAQGGTRPELLVAGLLLGGGATALVVLTVSRGMSVAGRRRSMHTDTKFASTTPVVADEPPAPPFSAAAALSGIAVPAATDRRPGRAPLQVPARPSEPAGGTMFVPRDQDRRSGDRTASVAPSAGPREVPPALDWLRSEAGDNRAAAALCAVDEALAAGGWCSRAAGASTRPDSRRAEVQVALALHPAERNIGAAVAERIAATHAAWHASYDGAKLLIDVPDAAGAPQALLLPALQLDADGAWTQYLHTPATLGLAITGAGAGDILHGVLADLVCMYPPANLALTVFSSAAELYREAPQWAEPPSLAPESVEQLAHHISAGPAAGVAMRPLLLAAVEPDDELVRALLALQQRAGMLRSPACALLVAAERPGAGFRALAAAMPALSVRSDIGARSAELRLAEQRIVGQPPCFTAGDMRELLRYLPRFGASPPPCIWDTIASSAP